MATKTTIARVDDLDGGPSDETVRFSLDGHDFEIDLNRRNASSFRRQIAPFLAHARAARRRGSRTVSSRERSATIRAWARSQGITVSDRGRLPATVIDRFRAATAAR
jgi:hypothetical protein